MFGKRLYYLKPFIIGFRKIYPLAFLKVLNVKNTFYNTEFTVVALKIVEKSDIYYVNISMNEKEFRKIKSKKK